MLYPIWASFDDLLLLCTFPRPSPFSLDLGKLQKKKEKNNPPFTKICLHNFIPKLKEKSV